MKEEAEERAAGLNGMGKVRSEGIVGKGKLGWGLLGITFVKIFEFSKFDVYILNPSES